MSHKSDHSQSSNQFLRYRNSEALARHGLLAFNTVKKFMVDLVFPPQCAGCGQVDTFWCDTCQAEADALPNTPIFHEYNEVKVASTQIHRKILRKAIHSLKYENAVQVAEPLAQRMADCIQQTLWEVDLVIPVPLHTKRFAERGYNQSDLLADRVAEILAVSYRDDLLERIKHTRSQTTLGIAARQHNVSQAFVLSSEDAYGLRVLLVDDVHTSGATLRSCASELLAGGAHAVYGLTITTAVDHNYS